MLAEGLGVEGLAHSPVELREHVRVGLAVPKENNVRGPRVLEVTGGLDC